jgi:antagonist of KipI
VTIETIAVLDGGALTTIQDAEGRRGNERFGVPRGGACDPLSARLANRLVGSDDNAGVLEVTLAGPVLRFDLAEPRGVAIAGADLGARLDGGAIGPCQVRMARPGSVLRFAGRVSGLRAYVAVAGGFAVGPLLGSVATDLRSGFGGLDGRPLRADDRLPLGPDPRSGLVAWAPSPLTDRAIHVLPGPHLDHFAEGALDALCAAGWAVSGAADRTGLRLEGGSIAHGPHGAEVPSIGLPVGAIQVPPDGRPIVMLADRPLTGGYAVLACVARADLGRLAQLIAGDRVQFVPISVTEALDALRRVEDELQDLDPVPEDGRDASWAGWPG